MIPGVIWCLTSQGTWSQLAGATTRSIERVSLSTLHADYYVGESKCNKMNLQPPTIKYKTEAVFYCNQELTMIYKNCVARSLLQSKS